MADSDDEQPPSANSDGDSEDDADWDWNENDDKIEHCGLLVEHLENGDTDGNSDDEPYSEAWLYGGDPDVNTPDSNPYGIEYDSDVDQSTRQL